MLECCFLMEALQDWYLLGYCFLRDEIEESMLLGCCFLMGAIGERVLLGFLPEVPDCSGYLTDCEAMLARRQDLGDR